MNRFATIGSMLILGAAFAACDTAAPPAAVQNDVTNAEAARSANVAEERREGAKEIEREQQDVAVQRRDVAEATVDRNYEVALAKADGDYKVAKELCEALSGSAQTSCQDQAELVLESEKTRAELLKTAAPPAAVQSDVANAEAARSANVAEERREGAKEIEREQQDVAVQRRDVAEATVNRNYEVALAKAEGDYKVAKELCEPLSGSAQTSCQDQAELVLESGRPARNCSRPRVRQANRSTTNDTFNGRARKQRNQVTPDTKCRGGVRGGLPRRYAREGRRGPMSMTAAIHDLGRVARVTVTGLIPVLFAACSDDSTEAGAGTLVSSAAKQLTTADAATACTDLARVRARRRRRSPRPSSQPFSEHQGRSPDSPLCASTCRTAKSPAPSTGRSSSSSCCPMPGTANS